MARPQYLQQGWRPNGPGRCICPHCRTTVSTNAMARARHRCPDDQRVADIKAGKITEGPALLTQLFNKG